MRWIDALAGAAASASLAALLGCTTPPTSEQAREEAAAMLEQAAAAVASGLVVSERSDRDEIVDCAWLPGWPTSERAWEMWRRYELGGGDRGARVQRLLDFAASRKGRVIYHQDDPRGGRGARVDIDGLDVFATATQQLEVKVRSRCFVAKSP